RVAKHARIEWSIVVALAAGARLLAQACHAEQLTCHEITERVLQERALQIGARNVLDTHAFGEALQLVVRRDLSHVVLRRREHLDSDLADRFAVWPLAREVDELARLRLGELRPEFSLLHVLGWFHACASSKRQEPLPRITPGEGATHKSGSRGLLRDVRASLARPAMPVIGWLSVATRSSAVVRLQLAEPVDSPAVRVVHALLCVGVDDLAAASVRLAALPELDVNVLAASGHAVEVELGTTDRNRVVERDLDRARAGAEASKSRLEDVHRLLATVRLLRRRREGRHRFVVHEHFDRCKVCERHRSASSRQPDDTSASL